MGTCETVVDRLAVIASFIFLLSLQSLSLIFYGIHLMEIIFYGASQLFVKMPKYEIIVNIFEHTSKQSGEGWGTLL